MSIAKRIGGMFARKLKISNWPEGVPELTVEEIHQSRARCLEMQLKHPIFAKLADELATMFDGAGAVNYLEYTVCSDKYGPMTVLIQKRDGETPAIQNERLRKRIAELEAELKSKGCPNANR